MLQFQFKLFTTIGRTRLRLVGRMCNKLRVFIQSLNIRHIYIFISIPFLLLYSENRSFSTFFFAYYFIGNELKFAALRI